MGSGTSTDKNDLMLNKYHVSKASALCLSLMDMGCVTIFWPRVKLLFDRIHTLTRVFMFATLLKSDNNCILLGHQIVYHTVPHGNFILNVDHIYD